MAKSRISAASTSLRTHLKKMGELLPHGYEIRKRKAKKSRKRRSKSKRKRRR